MSNWVGIWFQWVHDWGYPGIVILMALESSIVPIPSEIVIPPAAYWAAQGRYSFTGVVLAGTLGSYLGAAATYWMARWLGRPLLSECLDAETGELTPVVIVTDNGPAYKSAAFARYIASRPEFMHVRTRHRSPGTNGVIERFFQAVKYEHLYREELMDGGWSSPPSSATAPCTTPSARTRRSAGAPRSPSGGLRRAADRQAPTPETVSVT